ncbi:unnamed protein product [Prorocentrum cordatum]|uniref:Phosphoglycerate mutase n=2 Tax=Prorocentrum cordatum TaxID=2364126 RepID=A0ABN9T594_9DINO|nr:unnamed protein product [Polarella glacialis]
MRAQGLVFRMLVMLLSLLVGSSSGTWCSLSDGLQRRAEELKLCPAPLDGAGWAWPRNDPSDCATNSTGLWRVLMVRHAESIANKLAADFIASCTTSKGLAGCNHSYDVRDSPLSADGMQDAEEQGRSQALASLGAPDVVFISPMLRTIQTAMGVIPKPWLQTSTPPKLYFMPLLQECSDISGSKIGGGTWSQQIHQDWGHPPSTWFNSSCPPQRGGGSLDYNNTRATCLGYKSVKNWVKAYVESSSGGYRGFFSKAWYDFWEAKEVSNWSPDAETCRQNAQAMWSLLNSEFNQSRVMIVSHHQFLKNMISWPLDVAAPDPFSGHAPPSFVCSQGRGTGAVTASLSSDRFANHGVPLAPEAAFARVDTREIMVAAADHAGRFSRLPPRPRAP